MSRRGGAADVDIGGWLARARSAGVDRLDAQLLLARHLGRPRAWLLAHDDEAIAPALLARLEADLARRADGVPLAYLVGEREFCGLVLQVGADVLVPRPETEGLVEWALELAPQAPLRRLIDLGTGSGAVALAFRHRAHADFEVHASDRSEAALAVARANGARLGLPVTWHAGDWWEPLSGQMFGIAVSNPPYVKAGDPHLGALRHEPTAALVAGEDGLQALRAIVGGAPARLPPGGWLLLEHGHDQSEAVAALLAGSGFAAIQTRNDLAGLARLTGGRRPLA
ncbi:MAG: peptide chain release factor N(5)-glutamine methyltransferase [Rubrivivax sp.]|nr:peptide chain release factor N(5)-glutamine methyltransferase [Rubrivivax sp.]